MAMQTSQDSAFQRILLENVNPALAEHIQRTSPEISIFGGFETKKPEGKYWKEVAQTEGNFNMGPRTEDEWLPGHDVSALAEDGIAGIDTQEAKYYVKAEYQAVNFTDLMEELTNGGKTGFMNLARLKMKDIASNIKESMCLRLAGTGLGNRARIKSVSVSGSTGMALTLYAANESVTAAAAFEGNWFGGNNWLRVGNIYDAVDGSAGALGGAVRVAGVKDRGRKLTSKTLVSATTPTATFSSVLAAGDTTWAAYDYLVAYKSRKNEAALSVAADYTGLKHPIGILDVVDDGTVMPYIGGLDRTANPTYNALAMTIGTGTTTSYVFNDPALDHINKMCEQLDIVSGGETKFLYCHPSHRRWLMKHLTATVGYPGTATVTDGGRPRTGVASENPTRYTDVGAQLAKVGYGDLAITTIGEQGVLRLKTSRLAPMHVLMFIDPSTMKILNLKEPGFIKGDGLTIHRYQGKATYYADYGWYTGGIISDAYWKNGVIRGVKGDWLSTP